MKKLTFALFMSLSLWITAQPSQSFNYQAALRNSNGLPMENQSVLIRISLIDESGASVYYVENHQATTNEQGIVNLRIGNGQALNGVFADIPWATAQIFLKIEMESTGGVFVDMG